MVDILQYKGWCRLGVIVEEVWFVASVTLMKVSFLRVDVLNEPSELLSTVYYFLLYYRFYCH